MKCYMCNTESDYQFKKSKVFYYRCPNCKLFCSDEIPDDTIITENDKTESRVRHHKNRLIRITEALGFQPEVMLDLGCGDEEFIEFLDAKAPNMIVHGIDKDTHLQLKDIADLCIDAISVVEVIEHLYDPISIFNQFYKKLVSNGIIYIESSFIDHMEDPENNPYIDPTIGHCCIHSTDSIQLLADKCSFTVSWLNQNVCIFRKIS